MSEKPTQSVVKPHTRERRPRARREDFARFRTIGTRWRDNDVYGHVNNVVFYEYVDSAVNGWLVDEGGLDVPGGTEVGLVVESACVFHESIAWPDRIEAGLRVSRIGTSSVQYEVGIFREGGEAASAEARFTHVYVAADSRRPVPLPEALRAALEGLRLP